MTRSAKALMACFLIFLVSHLLIKVFDPDTWLHLHVGRFILHNGFIPSVNTFSFTEPGHPWMPHEWLSQVIFYLTYSGFGVPGLTILRASVFLAAFLILYRAIHEPGWETLEIAGLALAAHAIAVANRISDRPEMFSALFFSSYYYILNRWRRDGTRWIWLIPFMQAFWINMHGYFLFGLIFLFLFWYGEFGLPERAFWGSRRSRELLAVAGAGVAACLLNPHFHHGLVQAISVAATIGDARIAEWRPPYFSFSGFWTTGWDDPRKALILVSTLSFVLNYRKAAATRWFLWGVFLLAFLQSRRNVLFFSLVAIPVTISNFRQTLEGRTRWTLSGPLAGITPRRLGVFLELALAAVLLFGTYDMASGRFFADHLFAQPGVGISKVFYPEGIQQFVKEAGLEGPGFNNYGIGNYVMWRFPDMKVFMDGRNLEAYSEDFINFYHKVKSGRIPLPELLGRYKLRFFLINHQIDAGGASSLVKMLDKDKNWKLAYVDNAWVVFVPARKTGKLVVGSLDEEQVGPWNRRELAWRHYQMCSIWSRLERKKSALEECRKSLDLDPDFNRARQQLKSLENDARLTPPV
ncbi:MAG: hypothetical protein HY551_05110 [Elusimicrobia bacterium]|nr:hypothetical protein [Elusimicrobiota bacterium]